MGRRKKKNNFCDKVHRPVFKVHLLGGNTESSQRSLSRSFSSSFPPSQAFRPAPLSSQTQLPNMPASSTAGLGHRSHQPSSFRPRPSNAGTWGREEQSSSAPEVAALLARGAPRRDSRPRIGGKTRMTRYVRWGRPAPAPLRPCALLAWGGAELGPGRPLPGPRVR